jgi:mono/diheme cytochrome c family protein
VRLLVSVALLVATGASPAAEKIGGGKAAFMENCAVCHGSDGMGSGPFTSMLRVAPPNLTVLAQINDGELPDKQVRRTLEGFNMPGAHGNNEMPILGPALARGRRR